MADIAWVAMIVMREDGKGDIEVKSSSVEIEKPAFIAALKKLTKAIEEQGG